MSDNPSSQTPTSDTSPEDVFIVSPRYVDFVFGRATQLPPPTFNDIKPILIFAVFFILLLAILAANFAKPVVLLSAHTTGTVIRVYTAEEASGRSDTTTNYYVEFEYQIAQRTYEQRQNIPSSIYHTLSVGGGISVDYDPNNAANAAVAGTNPRQASADNTLLIGGALAVATLVYAIPSIRRLWQWRKLMRHGEMFEGTLIEIYEKETRRGMDVHFTFHVAVPDGCSITRKTKTPLGDLLHDELPEPGTPLAVLYAPPNIVWLM